MAQGKQDIFEMIMKASGEGYVFNPVKQYESRAEQGEWQAEPQEGQLSVDVINTDEDIVVVSTMAGADANKIDVYIHNDLLTIRGVRPSPVDDPDCASYLHQECFWGKFSRTVVLPVDVRGDDAEAEYRNGVLTIVIPKRKKDSRVNITIVED